MGVKAHNEQESQRTASLVQWLPSAPCCPVTMNMDGPLIKWKSINQDSAPYRDDNDQPRLMLSVHSLCPGFYRWRERNSIVYL